MGQSRLNHVTRGSRNSPTRKSGVIAIWIPCVGATDVQEAILTRIESAIVDCDFMMGIDPARAVIAIPIAVSVRAPRMVQIPPYRHAPKIRRCPESAICFGNSVLLDKVSRMDRRSPENCYFRR